MISFQKEQAVSTSSLDTINYAAENNRLISSRANEQHSFPKALCRICIPRRCLPAAHQLVPGIILKSTMYLIIDFKPLKCIL